MGLSDLRFNHYITVIRQLPATIKINKEAKKQGALRSSIWVLGKARTRRLKYNKNVR